MPSQQVLFVGRTTLDALYWLDAMPEENTKVFARRFLAAVGGPAANAAITHALLGGQTMLASAVGGGEWAAQVRAEFARMGIDLLDLAEGTAYETPLTSVVVNRASGSRTIVNPPVSEVTLRQLGAWQAARQVFGEEPPATVLTDGFFFDEARPLLNSLRDAGAALCLDGGSFKSGTDELAGLLTVAICSERFLAPGQSNGPEGIFDWFAARGVPYIAVTRGGEPILGWDRGRRFEIAIPAVDVVDTLGAGDVLHGAFCYYFGQGEDFKTALGKAAGIATLACQSIGTRAWAEKAATGAGAVRNPGF